MTEPNNEPLILVEHREGVAALTLNDPEKRNPLSTAMLEEISARLREAEADPAVRAIIIAHHGPAFSAGHNMRELVGAEREAAEALFRLSAGVMEQIRNLPMPVIAQIEGLASAAGCQLAASCDLVLAAETAAFQTPGVMIGLFCSTPMVPLSRAIPAKKAMEMLLTGRPIDAHEAERLGLVNRVIPAERLADETLDLAAEILTYSGDTIRMGKKAFYQQLPLPIGEAYELVRETMTENAMTEDAQEGMSAFLEKRPPNFKN
jgi:enoyl-CoA hydratase/carnithine racemase